MDERNENERMEEIMLPGFRFHPTDEELVGFYLKRKVQQQPLSMELIKQLDIYKYDPWDLPKLATTGEKEWLPSLADSVPPKRFLDKTIPANDSWAICRIFKKTNSTAQRALSNSWVSPMPETSSLSDMLNIPLSEKTSLNLNVDLLQTSNAVFPTLDFVPYKPITHMSNGDLTSVITSLHHTPSASKSSVDVTSMLLNMSSSMLEDHYGHKASGSLHFGGVYSGTTTNLPQEMQGNNMISNGDQESSLLKSLNVSHGGNELPFSLPLPMNSMGDAWKPSLAWDSSCPTEMSTSFCSTKYYT
ncbi:hypothetical protein GQ457_18G025290 [Hibiscus cannabinus]